MVSRFPKEVDLTEFEVGYLMGLIVGEGSFTGDRKKYRLDINRPLAKVSLTECESQ